jgi:hypothetical protein
MPNGINCKRFILSKDHMITKAIHRDEWMKNEKYFLWKDKEENSETK